MREDWLASFPGIREHEPLAPYSWYGIGGRARYFLETGDEPTLTEFIARLNREQLPYQAIGAGTNTLFVGSELPGVIIKLSNSELGFAGATVVAGAGTLMPKLAAESARVGRAGLEFGAGVPGTVGGSVFGNAGAFGREIKDALLYADVLDHQGRRQRIGAEACRFGYRDSIFKSKRPPWLIVRAAFATRPEPPKEVRARLLEVQKHRRATQPIEQRSLGSTFKNPPGDSAGRLIDAAGLKGTRIGGAQISPKHANFIVNVDGATADDVLALMAEMRDRVRQRFGIELEPEVRIMGPSAG
ncbi:MAG TPA: UDP-N-acetylmuramate dehydrogenase [Candidatus Dormibacteraeota bacterium]|nr:UDP-N-acetylmuramate dehydrogenase [Candidatus Dormibacteraeota bacterium]